MQRVKSYRSGFLNRGHGPGLRGPQAEAFTKYLCRDIANPKTKLGIFIDEQ